MFICYACARRRLSKDGKAFPFLESVGPCELCGHTRICKDVGSGLDWAWKQTATKTKPKAKS